MNKKPFVINWPGGTVPLGKLERGTIIDIYNNEDTSFRLVVINQRSQWFLVMTSADKVCREYRPVAVANLSSEDHENLLNISIDKPLALKFFEQNRTETLTLVKEVHLYPEEIRADPHFLEWADDNIPLVSHESQFSPEMLKTLEELRKKWIVEVTA